MSPHGSRSSARCSDRPSARGPAALLVGVAVIVTAACGPRAAGPVDLSGTWPDEPGSYREVHAQWSRHGVFTDYTVPVLEVHATFKSPAWRAAHAAYLAERQNMSNASRAALLAREREAGETGPYEVHLLVTTNDRSENDLHEGEDSVWRVVLADDAGNELEPMSIERDRRPRQVVRAEFPQLDDFAKVYVARFPRDIALLGPDARRFSLRIGSARGGVELVWERP